MNAAPALPVLCQHAPHEVVVWRQGQAVSAAQLHAQAHALARVLPRTRYAINLCESRRNFLAAFLATAQREQVSLLPSSRAPLAVREIQDHYPDHHVLTDELADGAISDSVMRSPLTIAESGAVAIVFTSGTTGRPTPHEKDWRTLLATARLAHERFLPDARGFNVVATVPAQHMYGFETTVTLILLSASAVSDARPLFPADVAAELAAVPAPRVLITTPAHLRACVASGASFPALELIISATAPLDRELAADAERRWNTRVFEIYGCTEAGSMASRRTTQSEHWFAYPGAWVEAHQAGATYHGAHLPEPVPLPDFLELESPQTFRLVGRDADLVKVAGKRASLAELTQRLLTIRGVHDAIVFVPHPDGRPAALVVASGIARDEILAALAAQLDPVLVPRPLLLVERLPRDALGKIPRAALLGAIGES
ncbi:MAG TPA: AMP-binding protein [Steroidobacteraceae bacterium]|nr:AMP-binding protein [Steroidobacteraceae bacterium]